MAARRAAVAQRAKANVIVVSVRLSIEFEDLKEFKHKARNFRPSDLDGVVLVFVSDDDREIEACVSLEAEKRGVLCNVADRQDLSSFIMPSIIDRSPLMLAISSGRRSSNISKNA